MRYLTVTAMLLVAVGACLVLASRSSSTTRDIVAPGAIEEPSSPSIAAVDPEHRADLLFFRGEYDEAFARYSEVIREQPERHLARFRRAYCLHELGDFEAASALHLENAEIPGLRMLSLYKRAAALSRLGRRDEALDALEVSVLEGYSDRERAEQDEDFGPLAGDPRFAALLERIGPAPKGVGPLDFWVGHWEVRDAASGEVIGHQTIDRADHGHLFTEQWNDNRGRSGHGLTYCDPADGRWKQVRVAADGGVLRVEGQFVDGVLTLSGTFVDDAGSTTPAEALLHPVADDRVRRTVRRRAPEGDGWDVLDDAILVRNYSMQGSFGGPGMFEPGRYGR